MARYMEFARVFMKIAEHDYKLALRALREGDYPEAVFHAQQAVEKAVKAMLEVKKKFVCNHGPALISVFEEAFQDEMRPEYDVVVEALDYLSGFYTMTRYPRLVGDRVLAPWDMITRDIGVRAVDYARRVLEIARRYLEERGVRDP